MHCATRDHPCSISCLRGLMLRLSFHPTHHAGQHYNSVRHGHTCADCTGSPVLEAYPYQPCGPLTRIAKTNHLLRAYSIIWIREPLQQGTTGQGLLWVVRVSFKQVPASCEASIRKTFGMLYACRCCTDDGSGPAELVSFGTLASCVRLSRVCLMCFAACVFA